jgi:hypothetical protein
LIYKQHSSAGWIGDSATDATPLQSAATSNFSSCCRIDERVFGCPGYEQTFSHYQRAFSTPPQPSHTRPTPHERNAGLMNEPFKMRRVEMIVTDQVKTSNPDCIYSSLGTDAPAPYVPSRYLKFVVHWSNNAGNGRTYCQRRRNAERHALRNSGAIITAYS